MSWYSEKADFHDKQYEQAVKDNKPIAAAKHKQDRDNYLQMERGDTCPKKK